MHVLMSEAGSSASGEKKIRNKKNQKKKIRIESLYTRYALDFPAKEIFFLHIQKIGISLLYYITKLG